MKRPVLPTMAALFVLIGAGQGVSALPGVEAWADKQANNAGEMIKEAMGEKASSNDVAANTPDDIEIVDMREASATPVLDEEIALRAQRYDLRQESERLAQERASLETAQRAIESRQRAEFVRLAKMYAQMPPSKAADVLGALEAREAALFVGLMPEPNGAAIMSSMPPAKAVAITRELLKQTPQNPT